MSGRVSKHLSFLARARKDIGEVKTATTAQVECIVEIIYNIINNDQFFLTDREIKVLKPVKGLLYEIAATRSVSEARCSILELDSKTFKTIIKAATNVLGI